MTKIWGRSALVALAILAALALSVPANAAVRADAAVPAGGSTPSGIGWSAWWSYHTATALKVAIQVPGAAVSAVGSDNAGTRAFQAQIIDDQANDGDCAYVVWTSAQYTTVREACNGSISFNPPATTAVVAAMVCRIPAAGGALFNCNTFDVPSSLATPAIRAVGNGFHWYYNDPGADHTNDWSAELTLGSVDFDYYGIDDFGGPGKRWVEAYLTLLNATPNCGSGTISGGTPPSSLSLCGGDQIQELPTTTVTGSASGQACVWSPRAITPIKQCVTVNVPLPN